MPQLVQFANNAGTTLNGAITNVATAITVTSSTGFPAITGSQYFYATLKDASNNLEIIKVTAISGANWTVARAQEGTTGRAYSNLDTVELRPTAAGLGDLYTQASLQYATTATAAGTTTLTNQSALIQYFTGSTTQTVVLPDATTLSVGVIFTIDNDSTGVVTVQTNGGATVLAMAGLTNLQLTLTANGTAAGTWDLHYFNGAPNLGILTMENTILLSADYTLTSQTAAQKLFNSSTNGRLTLPTGRYLFETMLYLTTMNAASGNGQFDVKGGGSATLGTSFMYVNGLDVTAPLTAAADNFAVVQSSTSAASMVTAATGTGLRARLSGFFTVTAAGTIVPSIALVTANAAVVKAGSYFTCRRIMADTQTTVGNWD